jgi:hypothetical protein
VYAFQREGEAVLALWARDALVEPAVLSVDLGPEARQFDLMGAEQPLRVDEGKSVLELTSAPIYLIVRGLPAEEALQRIGTPGS